MSLIPFARADEASNRSDLASAITGGDAHVALRYRFEHVGDDAFLSDANASTLRLRLNYRTGAWNNWSSYVEFDYVGELLVDDFNSGAGTSSFERNRYPVVADPSGADLNQLFIEYSGFKNLSLRVGRQRILIDNQRFVGGVGWRQNEQTYDAVSGIYAGWQGAQLSYRYISSVRRIFGSDVAAGRHDVNAHLLHAEKSLTDDWKVKSYAYQIDNADAPGFSTLTIGLAADGSVSVPLGKATVHGEIARQKDAANNPIGYSANYIHGFVNWQIPSQLSLKLGFERLGGDRIESGRAFRTPLATLHALQGWADKFLVTPDRGIDDVYFGLGYHGSSWNLQSTLHQFSAAEGSGRWGRELDVSAARKLGDRYNLLIKAAWFDTQTLGFTDTRKLWVQLHANY